MNKYSILVTDNILNHSLKITQLCFDLNGFSLKEKGVGDSWGVLREWGGGGRRGSGERKGELGGERH